MDRVTEKALGFDVTLLQRYSSPETIYFWWGRSPAVVYWAASYFTNGLYAYGDQEDQLLNRLKRAVKLSTQQYREPKLRKAAARPKRRSMEETGFKDHGQVVFYDFGATQRDLAVELTKLSRDFVYRVPPSLTGLLRDLNVFRDEVRAAYSDTPYGPKRRTGLLMFLKLDADALQELHSSQALLDELEEFFTNAHKERIYPILATKEASDLSVGVVKAAESAIFVGDANQKLAEAFYKVPVHDRDFGSIRIGVVWDITKPDALRRMAPVRAEKEQWVIERQAALEKQDADWDAYLEALEEQRP